MNYKGKMWLGAALAAAVVPFMASSALAACPGDAGQVPLRDASGAIITDATTPYSPKMTCMGTGTTGCHTMEEYASAALKTVTKTQGVIDTNTGVNEVFWQSYNVHAHAHGSVIGRHSQQGRNEDYSISMKNTFGDPFFTSSPGMFGKY